jgi:hypothetical protein
MRRRTLLLGAVPGAAFAAPEAVICPRPDAGRSLMWRYLGAAIELGLARSGHDYAVQATGELQSQERGLRQLLSDDGSLDLIWTMTTTDRERQLRPVRLPLDRGLLGCRLALVRAGDRRFDAVQRLGDLAAFTAGQGHDWPDTDILRANGLKVSSATRYEALFDMLRLGRIDYLPRSLLEIDGELANPLGRGLAAEPRLVLIYLFVRPGRARLAADLQRGLDIAAADGSLGRLFANYFGDLVGQYRLRERRVLVLLNPLAPAQMPRLGLDPWLQSTLP